MIVAGSGLKVVVATRPVDFRKGHDGLVAVVEHELGLDPYSGTVLVGPVSGERTIAGKELTDIALRHRIAVHVVGNTLAEPIQHACTGEEPCTMVASPRDIVVDCVSENHAKPSRSMSATSRRAPSCTLAYTEVAATLRCPR